MTGASTNTCAPCKKTAWLKSLLSIGGDSSDASPQHEPVPSITKTVGKKRRKSPSEQEMVTARQNDCRNSKVDDKKMVGHDNNSRVRKNHEERNSGNDSGLRSETQELRRSSGKKRPVTNRVPPSAESIGEDKEERRQRKLKEVDSFPPRRRPHFKLGATKNITDKEKALEFNYKDPTKAKAAAARQRRMRKLRARRIATGEHERLQAIKLKRQELFEMARLSRNQRGRMRKIAPAGATTETDSHDEGAAVGPKAQLPSEKEATVRERNLELQNGVAIKAKSALNRPQSTDYKKARRQQRMQDALHVLGAELESHSRTSSKQQKLEHNNDVPESDAGRGIARAKPFRTTSEKQDGAAVTSQVRDADTRFVQVSHYTSESESQEKPTEIREQCQDTNTAEEIKEEGEVDSPAAGKRHDVDENTIRDEKRHTLLDLTPIPRKVASDATAVPFMIPKRSVRNTGGKIETRDMTRITPAGQSGGVGPFAPAALLFPVSTPQLSDREPIQLQRRRTKNPVPVKSSVVATQDQELLRVARRHNSIFLAAAELAAQSSLANGKVEGYEVRNVDGKVFPDLASRLNGATKHNMAEDKHSVDSSYFGVSLAVPKAKGTSSPTNDEHRDTENRTLNCYEMLRFERPEDREFYQRRMYGTTFVPQHLCGRATLIMRTARFERKSTGIRFNQDRDREEFAASLGKRYTFKKSEPRCEIPRENWQRITKAQGGTVYLHYSNLEDAERASFSFRDDAGNRLELKGTHDEHRVSSSPGLSPSNGAGCRHSLARSCSSERSLAESPSLSSQYGGARQDRQRNVHRYSQYDRPLSAQREAGYSRYGREYRSRSRSRSRAELFSDQQFGTVANRSCGVSRNEAVVTGSSAGLSEGQGSNNTSGGDKKTGEYAQPEPVAQDKVPPEQEIESGEEQEEGEIESSSVFIPGYRQQTYDEQSYQQQENYRGRPYEQQYRRRSRSRSRPRPDGRWDGGRHSNDWDDSYAKDDGFDSGRRTYLNEMDHHGGRDYHDGEYEGLWRETYTYSRSYY